MTTAIMSVLDDRTTDFNTFSFKRRTGWCTSPCCVSSRKAPSGSIMTSNSQRRQRRSGLGTPFFSDDKDDDEDADAHEDNDCSGWLHNGDESDDGKQIVTQGIPYAMR